MSMASITGFFSASSPPPSSSHTNNLTSSITSSISKSLRKQTPRKLFLHQTSKMSTTLLPFNLDQNPTQKPDSTTWHWECCVCHKWEISDTKKSWPSCANCRHLLRLRVVREAPSGCWRIVCIGLGRNPSHRYPEGTLEPWVQSSG